MNKDRTRTGCESTRRIAGEMLSDSVTEAELAHHQDKDINLGNPPKTMFLTECQLRWYFKEGGYKMIADSFEEVGKDI
jgi:hypothetical protein